VREIFRTIMSRNKSEVFIRRQVRRALRQILLEQDDKQDDKQQRAAGKFEVIALKGSGGDISGDLKKIFAGEGVDPKDVKADDLLSRKNPSQLMKNLGLSTPAGTASIEKLKNFLNQAVSVRAEMSSVYDKPTIKKDSKGRIALHVRFRDLTDHQGHFFIKETLKAAEKSGYVQLSEKILRVAKESGHVVVYPAKDRKDKWGQ